MSARGVLRIAEGGLLLFWCPGCNTSHGLTSGWKFNGDYDLPTFSPSVLVTSGHYANSYKQGADCWCTFNEKYPDQSPTKFTCSRCHSYIRNGKIEFLGDCTHALVGQTVSLKPF